MVLTSVDARGRVHGDGAGRHWQRSGRILQLLVGSPLCRKVVVVTRRSVAGLANPKVQQVVVNMDALEEQVAPHAKGVDIALAAFGVGKGSAKMADEDVRKIEVTYPTAFASAARVGGARVMAMMTAVGANSQSWSKYIRIFGDKEKRSEALAFDFLGLYRPAMILGNSNTPSALGVVMPLLHWAMPSRYHSIHKNDLARAMVAQSEQAFSALAQGEGPAGPVVRILDTRRWSGSSWRATATRRKQPTRRRRPRAAGRRSGRTRLSWRYSERSAIEGSTCAARHAGKAQATPDVANSRMTTPR